jgi:uncharacterized Zn finger protein
MTNKSDKPNKKIMSQCEKCGNEDPITFSAYVSILKEQGVRGRTVNTDLLMIQCDKCGHRESIPRIENKSFADSAIIIRKAREEYDKKHNDD